MNNRNKIFDGLLVLQYRSGDKKAMNLLVRRYQLQFCNHAYWYTRDMDAAKDIVQDSWTTIIRKLSQLNNVNGFRSWALRIVTRKSLDYLDRNKNISKNHSEVSIQPDDETTEKTEQLMVLKKAIQKLTHDHRIVLKLFYLQEYSLREISDILEISTGTVKSRLYHAREKLKSIIKN